MAVSNDFRGKLRVVAPFGAVKGVKIFEMRVVEVD